MFSTLRKGIPMDELKMNLETEIALTTKHLEEDKARTSDPILGQFFRGRVAVEEQTLTTLRKISDIANRL